MTEYARTAQMAPMPETSRVYYTMECQECGIEEGLSEDHSVIDERTLEHNAAYHERVRPRG